MIQAMGNNMNQFYSMNNLNSVSGMGMRNQQIRQSSGQGTETQQADGDFSAALSEKVQSSQGSVSRMDRFSGMNNMSSQRFNMSMNGSNFQIGEDMSMSGNDGQQGGMMSSSDQGSFGAPGIGMPGGMPMPMSMIGESEETDGTQIESDENISNNVPQMPGGMQGPGGMGQMPGDMQGFGEMGQMTGGTQGPGGMGQMPGGMQGFGGMSQMTGGMQGPGEMGQMPGGMQAPGGVEQMQQNSDQSTSDQEDENLESVMSQMAFPQTGMTNQGISQLSINRMIEAYQGASV